MKKIIALSLIMLILYGCSNDSIFEGFADDSGLEAILEDAAEAIDDGNYYAVVTALSAYYTTTAINPDVARLLASGYMGLAGIDVTSLVAYSYDDPYHISPDPFDMAEATLSLTQAPIVNDAINCNAQLWMVLIYKDEAPDAAFIDGHCVGELISNLEDAKGIFDKLQDSQLATYDDYVQHGIASAVHYVLFLGNAVAEALNPYSPGERNYREGSVPAPINRAAYQFYNSDLSSYEWSQIEDHSFNEELDEDELSPYQRDLIDVNNAIEATGQVTLRQNDIQDDLDNFLREVLMIPEGDITTSTITSMATTTGIYNYIISMSQGG